MNRNNDTFFFFNLIKHNVMWCIPVSLAQLIGILYFICRDRGSNFEHSISLQLNCELSPLNYLTKKTQWDVFYIINISIKLFDFITFKGGKIWLEFWSMFILSSIFLSSLFFYYFMFSTSDVVSPLSHHFQNFLFTLVLKHNISSSLVTFHYNCLTLQRQSRLGLLFLANLTMTAH